MIKIIVGFRDDQYHVINDHEAHKAYYLFNNPEARTTFENGVALVGKSIQGIEPAFNETMGWIPTHKLDDDDWAEIRAKGIDRKLRDVLSNAKTLALDAQKNPEILKSHLQLK